MGGSNPRRAKETMLFTTKGNKNDHIIPLSIQREKEIGWPCPTTNTKRQRAREYGRQATTHTKPSNTKTKKLTLHHSIIKTKREREREDVFHHHQNKMRESTGQATTAHTKPFITTTKWGGRTQSGGSNPATQSTKSHASPKQKEIHHVPRGNYYQIIRLLTQNTKRERER